MKLWRKWRARRAYDRAVAHLAENEVVREAEEIVGAAWMAGLAEAERKARGRVTDRHDPFHDFVARERRSWASAARLRALEAIADREELVAAARRA